MKVLVVGTDRKLFEEGSDIRERVKRQGAMLEELHVIVYAKKGQGALRAQLAANIFVYSTESHSRLLYVFDALRIAKSIEGIDVVSTQDPFECGLAGHFIARRKKVPLQLQLHTDMWSDEFVRQAFLNRIRRLVAVWLFQRASCVRVVSERARESLKKRKLVPGIPVAVLPVYVELDELLARTPPSFELHTKYPQFNFIILMCSRLAVEKRIDVALDAFHIVATKYPRVGVVIVGDGSRMGQLQRKTIRLGLGDRVVFEGWQEDLVPYYKSADMYLLTSEYEGFGRTLIEAAAVGRAIVSTDVGIAGSVLIHSESALICPVGDIECIARHIEELVENNALRTRLGITARSAVERTFSSTKEKYYEVMKHSFETCLVNEKKLKVK